MFLAHTVLLSCLQYSLTFTATLLLPLDLAVTEYNIVSSSSESSPSSSSSSESSDSESFDSAVSTSWILAYWVTFFLSWIVLGIIHESIQSGFLTPKQKFVDAVRANARFFLIAGTALLIVVVVLFASTTDVTVFHLLLAVGNTYGLLIALLLLSYGLVEVPRSLWTLFGSSV